MGGFNKELILAFDIETIPDVAGVRTLYQLSSHLSDAEVVEFIRRERRALTGREMMPLYLNQVVAISCCFRDKEDKILVKSLGEPESDEETLLKAFFGIIDKYAPRLVSWNGGGFDLPVLQQRALIKGVPAAAYWDMGEINKDAKWNNYIGRYQLRHIDLMDILALYQNRAFAPLDAMAKLCGFPGKLGFSGAEVWDAYREGRIKEIRDYCDTDAMNTYLLFLRWELCRGRLSEEDYLGEVELLKAFLEASPAPHWQEFLAAFKAEN